MRVDHQEDDIVGQYNRVGFQTPEVTVDEAVMNTEDAGKLVEQPAVASGKIVFCGLGRVECRVFLGRG